MPTAKTECTELSVGFGLLDVLPSGLSEEQILNLFSGSLPIEKYHNYLHEFESQPNLYNEFLDIGRRLRNSYPLFTHLSQVTWTGPQQQAATTSASKDLIAANVPISVKNKSNVVLNASPYNLFVTIPSGSMPAANSDNWYHSTDPNGIQALYLFVQMRSQSALPETYTVFDQTASQVDRNSLKESIGSFSENTKLEFTRLYRQMCGNVSSTSANTFNNNLQTALSSNIKNSVLENIVKQFFRVNAVPYILVGLDDNHSFGLQIPDITEWKKSWRIIDLTATPDLSKGQSIVDIRMIVEERTSKVNRTMEFQVQIRWSHGKFCGNPEAKLYKKFTWSSVPFFTNLFVSR